jgi:hypothetical protein
MLLQAEFDSLVTLFNSLPDVLPLRSPGSKLPPQIDLGFATEEGVWVGFNKAMHAAWGEKSKGLKVEERGEGITGTVKLVKWCLTTLEQTGDTGSALLVGTWIEALAKAARAAIAEYAKPANGTSAIHSRYPGQELITVICCMCSNYYKGCSETFRA